MTYVESLRVFDEGILPVSGADFTAAVRERAEQTIAEAGVWTAITDAGVLVCVPA
jgi:hypothetical protein